MSWGLVIKEIVTKMVSVVGKSKPSGLSSFLFHLYEHNELLRRKEVTLYKSTDVMLQFNISLEPEPKETREASVGELELKEEHEVPRGKGKEVAGEGTSKDPMW